MSVGDLSGDKKYYENRIYRTEVQLEITVVVTEQMLQFISL